MNRIKYLMHFILIFAFFKQERAQNFTGFAKAREID